MFKSLGSRVRIASLFESLIKMKNGEFLLDGAPDFVEPFKG